MKYKYLIIGLLLIMIPNVVFAGRGCCSHHGGVAGCHSSGKQICNDGTLSPSCTCTPEVTYIYGCTDSKAQNYNKEASKDDGSCEYLTFNDEEDKIKDIAAEINDNNLEDTSEGNSFLDLLVLGAGGYGIYKFANKKKKKG